MRQCIKIKQDEAIFVLTIVFGLLCGMMLFAELGSNYMKGVL